MHALYFEVKPRVSPGTGPDVMQYIATNIIHSASQPPTHPVGPSSCGNAWNQNCLGLKYG